MKKVLVALLLLLPTQVFAGEIFNGTLGVASDYVWRGYSQNSGNVAASGGVGVALGSFTTVSYTHLTLPTKRIV